MPALKNIIGQRFGRLVVIERAPNKGKKSYWMCRCDCGGTTVAYGTHLRRGLIRSDGCLRREVASTRSYIHGGIKTREYGIWADAKNRCLNPHNQAYDSYGGRGITFCDEWINNFGAFIQYIGPCPENMSLDRYPDNDGPYAPGNVRWATRSQQMKNRRPRKEWKNHR